MSMEQIKDTIKEVMAALITKKNTEGAGGLEKALAKILGKKEKKHVKLGYFRKGTLGLSVDSSAWLYHLSLQKEKLLAKLTRKYDRIKTLRFYLTDK